MKQKTILLLLIPVLACMIYLIAYEKFFTNVNNVNKESNAPVTLSFVKVIGEVTVNQNGRVEPAVPGLKIEKNATVKAGSKALAIIGYGPGFSSKIKVSSNTSFDFSKYDLNLPGNNEGLSFHLLNGSLMLQIFNPSKQKNLKIVTRTASMGIRGTTFLVQENKEDSVLIVKEGAVEIENQSRKMVEANDGYKISETGPMQIDITKYNINWNLDDEGDLISTNGNRSFPSQIQIALDNLKDKIVITNQMIDSIKSDIHKHNNEIAELEKDRLCAEKQLNSKKVLCLYSSILAKNEDFNMLKADEVLERINNSNKNHLANIDNLSKDIPKNQEELKDLENRYLIASKKFNEIKSMQSDQNADTLNAAYNEIVEILNDEELRTEFQNIKP